MTSALACATQWDAEKQGLCMRKDTTISYNKVQKYHSFCIACKEDILK